jgi:hypothetical protein
MSKIAWAGALIGLLCAGPALAAGSAPVPDFSGGWDGDGENEFTPPKSGPGPVTSDPAHHYVSNFEARRILMDQQHSADPKPTWYGESIGHYEGGDTLVIDTIALNDKTFVDSYRTPHTRALHVVERFRLIEGGKALAVDFTVEDPGAFNAPWSAGKRWLHVQAPLAEEACAENNANYFSYEVEPLPQAERPDF